MSFFNDNVLPGDTGRVFRTNAEESEDLHEIAEKVYHLEGVHDVGINRDVFPVEFTIHSDDFSVVSIDDIEQAAIDCGFHLIPRSNFNVGGD